MQIIICRHFIDITRLKGFASAFAVIDPKNAIAKIAFIFTMIIFDGPRNTRDTGGGFIIWQLKRPFFTAVLNRNISSRMKKWDCLIQLGCEQGSILN